MKPPTSTGGPPASEPSDPLTGESRARERAMKLHAVAAALTRATSGEEVADAVVNEGMEALEAEAAVAYLADDAGRQVLRAWRGLESENLAHLAIMAPDAPVPLADAIRTGESIWIESLGELLERYPALHASRTPQSKLHSVVCVPLSSEDRTIGGVAFSFGSPRRFDEDERRFLLTVVSLAAIAAERCKLRHIEEASRSRLLVLAAATRRFSEARLELRDTLDTIARAVATQLGESCVINLLTADGQLLEPVAVADVDPEVEAAIRQTMAVAPVRMDEGSVVARVAATGEVVLIPEIPQGWGADLARPEYNDHLERFPLTSLLVVPLPAREAIIGAITAARRRGSAAYTRDDLVLLEDLATRAGMAIANARQHEELQVERARLDLLASASEILASSLDYEETLERVIALALPALGDFGYFDVREPEGAVRRLALAHRDPERQRLLDDSRWTPSERRDRILCGLSTGSSGFHPHIDDDWLVDASASPDHLTLLRALSFGSMITVPLAYHGSTLGALTLFFASGGRRHSEADLRQAEELARRAAASVENARLFRAAREAVAGRDEFLSIAGHELNSPLAALQLQIQSLHRKANKEELAPDFIERLKKTEAQAIRIERLVSEMLDVARITSGRLTIKREPMDLVASVNEAIARLTPQATSAGCAVRLSAPESLRGRWDRMRIEQVVSNLLANSIKYAAGRPIDVSVAEDGVLARITVRDFGIGISPDDEARIFGRFERAVSQRHYGGLGIGLWIARQIVEAHGGTIEFERPADVGTRFVVQLALDGAD